MSDWNPHASGVVGLQWPASRQIDTSLTSGNAAVAIIDAKTTETVDRLRMFLAANTPGADKGALFDIYDAANMDHGDARCYHARPNVTRSQTAGWRAHSEAAGYNGGNVQNGETADLWRFVNTDLDVNDPWSDTATGWIRFAPTQYGPTAGIIEFGLSPTLSTCDDHTVAAPAGTPISGTDRVVRIDVSVIVDFVGSGYVAQQAQETLDVSLKIPSYQTAGQQDILFGGRAGPYVSPAGMHGINHQFTYHTASYTNYETFAPITVADWQALCGVGASCIQIRTSPVIGYDLNAFGNNPSGQPIPEDPQSPFSGFRIYNVQATLWVVAEKRVATGVIKVETGPGPRWFNGPTKNPSTFANASFTKTANHTYYVVVRDQPAAGGGITWRAMDCGNTADHVDDFAPFLRSSSVSLVPAFAGSGLFSERLPPFEPETPAYALTLSSGFVNRVDGSQPYVELKQIGLWNPSHYLLQEFGTAHAAAGYGMARVMILNWGGMRGPLTVALTRTGFISTYATETLAPEDLEPTDVAWQLHDVELDPTTPLVVGQEAQLVCVPSAQAAFGPWILGVLSTREDLQFNNVTTMGDLTFQGTVGLARYLQQPPGGGPVEDSTALGINWSDAPFQILRQPAALTGFVAGPLTQGTLPELSGPCAVTNIPYIGMSWVPSTLGVGWVRYEVERFNPNTGLWDRIGDLAGDELDAAFADFEIPSDVEQGYRIRVKNNLGVPSPWTTILPSVRVIHQPWVLYLVSNVNPTRNVAYQYETPEEWVDVDGESLVVRRLFGRDRQLAFKPFEERGLRFTKNLIIASGDPAVIGTNPTVAAGPALFARLRGICRDPLLPYVAVIDHYGNRWYTAPRVTGMKRTNPGEQHLASVEFVEVGVKPFPSGTIWSATP